MPHYRRADNNMVTHYLTNNLISPDNPFTLIWAWGGFQGGSIYVTLVETDGWNRPVRNDVRLTSLKRRIKQWGPKYVGTMKNSQLKAALPEMLALRDSYNFIHQIRLGKLKLTEEINNSITTPDLRRELVEAVCLAAVNLTERGGL